jgi:hypothetical protein
LSRRRHPSLEEPPRRREPQLLSVESFASLGEHPRVPLSILPFSLSRLVHQSALAAVLQRVTSSAMAQPVFPYRATVGPIGANLHRPSMDQRPGLEPDDTPSCFKLWPEI